jgi:hypothetical protein
LVGYFVFPPFQRLDLVQINTEVMFAGSDTAANTIKAVDTTMNSLKGTYGIVSATTCAGALSFQCYEGSLGC